MSYWSIRPTWRTALRRRCPTTRSMRPPRGRRDRTSTGTPTTGCASCLPTSSRTSCTWTGRASWARLVRSALRPDLPGVSEIVPARVANRRPRDLLRIRGHGGGRLHAGLTSQRSPAKQRAPDVPSQWIAQRRVDRLAQRHAPYVYGAGFHTDPRGDVRTTSSGRSRTPPSRRVPYTASRVFKRVYGKPLGDLWQDYQTSLAASAGPRPSLIPRPGSHSTVSS